jgi:hypothetical protein
LRRSEFSTVSTLSLSRTAIGRAPDGTVGLQMNIPKGQNASNTFFVSPLGSRGVDAACLSLRVFLPNGFEWPAQPGGTKMGWGLWGGDEAKLVGGGTPPNQQLGWSVRNVNNQYGFRLYSYNLNRPNRFGQYSKYGAAWMSSAWRTGRWHKIEMEVVMNTPGRANGYAQLWLDGKDRRTMTNLVFRNNTSWAIRGLMFNDMWGGNTADPVNFSPKSQRMWYANYKLYTGRGATSVQASAPSSNPSSTPSSSSSSSSNTSSGSSTSSGAFGPIAPSGSVGGRNVTLAWSPDSGADKYYVRVLTRRANWSDRKDIYGGSVWPRSCSGSQCTVSIGNLPRDQYEWMVRPIYGSRNGDYKRMSFDVVDANSQTAASQPSSQQSGSSSSGTTSSRSTSSSSGQFGAVSPSGSVGGSRVTLNWRPDPKADKYYVRVLTKRTNWSDRKDMYGRSVWPNACSSSQCTVNIGNLPRDQYEWMVRPQYGSRNGEYSVLSFDVR